jgi:hypothetical protein
MKGLSILGTLGMFCVATTAQQYVISSYAGGALFPTPVQGTAVSIGEPISVAADHSGNIYFASPGLNAVFKLDPGGMLTRFAGTSKPGYSGDGGPAVDAQLNLFFGNASAVPLGWPSTTMAMSSSRTLAITRCAEYRTTGRSRRWQAQECKDSPAMMGRR